MYYRLEERIGLRSWWLVPYAYYVRNYRDARPLTKEEYAFLSLCDSTHDLPRSGAEPLIGKGLIRPCAKGEAPFTPWQKMECANRYFPSVCWMITGKCNYNCAHCFNAADNAPLAAEFSLRDADRFMDEAQAAGINAFTLTGGEPMAHPGFFRIVEGIHRRGMYVEELNTNGYFLTPEALQRLREAGSCPLIKISFDGVGYHDQMRGHAGAEQDALRAIRLCVENGFQVKVQTNVNSVNAGVMEQTLCLLDELGVRETRVIRTSESPRWVRNGQGKTLDVREYYDLMLALLKKYAAGERKMALDTWQFVRLDPKERSMRLHPVRCTAGTYKSSIPLCAGNRGMISVAADGNVYPCLQMSGLCQAAEQRFGNVHDRGLIPLLQSGPYLDEVCAPVGELLEPGKACAGCRFFKACCGGCRALALSLRNDTRAEDPTKCVFFQNGYYERILDTLQGIRNLTPMEL